MNEIKRDGVCCFTGHRPEKLGLPEDEVRERLAFAVQKATEYGFNTFISGMARGVDLWGAEAVLELKRNNNNIKLICALPHPDFEKRWSKANQDTFNSILKRADEVHTICDTFSMGAYMKRNKWMVDKSSLVIAFYNGESGGTKNTIDYAKDNNVNIIMLNK